MSQHFSIIAPAKVNLCLHITGKRDDGFHLLESLTVFTDFGDRLDLREAKQIQLEITGPYAQFLKHDPVDNLVVRAAKLLREELGIEQGAHITLDKQIPIGAGLGGGSADAAATLRALPDLWKQKVSQDTLLKIAQRLGSDVPACLISQPVWMRGAGELLEYVSLPIKGALLLVNPNIALSTVDVYKAYRPPFSPSASSLRNPKDINALTNWLSTHHNALAQPAQQLAPDIGKVLALIRAQEGCLLSRMSGSGATCFGIFSSNKQADAAAAAIQSQQPDWWLRATNWRNGDHDGEALDG